MKEKSVLIIAYLAVIAVAVGMIGPVVYFAIKGDAREEPLTVEGTLGSATYSAGGFASCSATTVDLGEAGIWIFNGAIDGLVVGHDYRFSYEKSNCGRAVWRLLDVEVIA